MKFEFQVQNVKCSGCASTIQNELGKDSRVKQVTVDVAKGLVTVISDEEIRADLNRTLKVIGYPEKTA